MQPLRATDTLKATMATYFDEVRKAATQRTKPVAWCSSVGPAEILRALGFVVYFPENHGAMLGASRLANNCMGRAHARGYSPEICSYLTSDVGSYLSGETPLKSFGFENVPKADVLCFNTNQCRDVRDWFEFYGREWNVPVLGITAVRDVDDVSEDLVEAEAKQFEALVPQLEAIAGTKLDAARLAEVMETSSRCTQAWGECLELCAQRPAPMSFFDACIHMGPAVVLRGSELALDYYAVLRAELHERVRAGTGAVANERFRLYWDGMPIWGRLRKHAELFASLDACVVASTYCHSWVFNALDPADPFRSMARASLELFIARAERPKERYLEKMVERFEVDGIIFHDSRTCPNNSNARYGMPNRLRERLGRGVLTIDGDLCDLRCVSDEQLHTNVEGFIEQLADEQLRAGA